jgi:ATP-binding cassette subfamily B protein
MVLMTGIAAALLLWIGGREVMRGEMTLGSYVAFNGYLLMLTWPMAAVGFMINLSQRGIASMKRIEDVMKVEPEIYDISPPLIKGGEGGFKGKIELKSLTFSYTGKENVLSNIALKIPAGSSLALAGAVGSGKSTIVKLMLRIYDAADGAIFIDECDIKKMPLRLLREIIGYVEQEPFLFSGAIRANIIFGIKDASDDDIDKAVSMAGLDRDMEIFPDGLDTVIGERGLTLSGGQKQRVALARAIIKKPKILILDDGFSNLDASTEERVFENIRSSLRNTTIILISHRISTIKEADKIAVMKDGGIGEIGTHDELISKGGLYQRIYKKQFFSEMELVEE